MERRSNRTIIDVNYILKQDSNHTMSLMTYINESSDDMENSGENQTNLQESLMKFESENLNDIFCCRF